MKRDNHPDDEIDYYQDQKHGISEIFVCIRIPKKHYETAYAFHKITNHASFDDYVSDCVVRDVETLLDGVVTNDLIHEKLTQKNSPWAEDQKKHWKGVNKRLKRQAKLDSGV